jgi:hypothetical protein
MVEMFLDEHIWELLIVLGTVGIWAVRIESRMKHTTTKLETAELQGEVDVLDTSVIVLVKTTDRIEGKVDRLLEKI